MPLTFQNKELVELMKDFYNLSGLRMVLFDEDYNEIVSYPTECMPFCAHMRRLPVFYEKCCQSDRKSFAQCRKTQSFRMYKCHAGLIECTAPILNNGSIIGYIMFGQISDIKDKNLRQKRLLDVCKIYAESTDIADKIGKIKYKSPNQLLAASKILETCTSYILHKEMVRPSRVKMFNLIDQYITEHLGEDLCISSICAEFNISRTSLYALMKHYISGGLAAYIKDKRLLKAKELLHKTDMSVSEIASAVGFSDYNYFLKAFKKRFQSSTKEIRKSAPTQLNEIS